MGTYTAIEIQTCSPKPIRRMCVHWRQQNSHEWNGNARHKLDQSIRTEIIKEPGENRGKEQLFHELKMGKVS